MLRTVPFILGLTLTLASPAPPKFGPRSGIVGGQEATPHQFPWQISLQYMDFPFHHFHTCGATIVDSTHIVCAAHCIDGRRKSWFKVKAGAHNIHSLLPESTVQTRNVAEMWTHESWDDQIITNDVSVLKLDEPLEFNEYVQPLPLAAKDEEPVGGTVCSNSGWGSTSDSTIQHMPNKLQYVEMPIVDRQTCQAAYSGVNGVGDGMICAGLPEGGVSACSGDSGGPLSCPREDGSQYLAGIVSWGMIPCGQPNLPSVYTNVGHFRDWIDEHLAM